MKRIEVVAAVIINNQNEILITKRKHKSFNGLWEFPGGKIEINESHEKALKREIREELNLTIEVNDFLTTVEYNYESFYLIMHVYVCQQIETNINLSVHSEAKWIKQDELNNYEWVPADVLVLEPLKKYLT